MTASMACFNSSKLVVVSQLFLHVNDLSVISAVFAALQTACFAGVTIIEKCNTPCAVQPYIYIYISQSNDIRLASAVAVELMQQDLCFSQEYVL